MFNREFCKKYLGVRLIETVRLIEKLSFLCDCCVQTQRNNNIFNIFNDKMAEKRLKTVCFSNE